ncbi:MAG: hypothetical protein ABEJ42_04100 [Halobacteriaceae archaeon]
MSDASVGEGPAGDLSCRAKLARVVLENRGPLSARELAEEARIGPDDAAGALAELSAADLAAPVCGVCDSREEVYALADEAAGGAGVDADP